MSAQLKKSTWPVICILGCLFVLSLAAPRAWEHAARRQAVSEMLEETAAIDATVPEICAPSPERVRLSPQPPVVPTQALVVPDEVSSAPETQMAHPAEKIASHPIEFDDPSAVVSAIDDQSAADAEPAAAETWTVPDESRPPEMDGTPPSQSLVSDGLESTGPSLLASIPQRTQSVAREPAPLTRLPAVEGPAAESSAAPPAPIATAVRWKVPASLVQRLKRLSGDRATAGWAADVEWRLVQLSQQLNAGSDQVGRLFAELRRQAERSEKLADKLAPAPAGELRRTSHAVVRRIEVWKQALAAAGPELATTQARKVDPERLALCLANLKGIDGQSPMSKAWQQYLLVDSLKGLAQAHSAAAEQESHQLARQVLVRLTRTQMNDRQRTLAQSPSAVALRNELERWAVEPVALTSLVDALERFEQSGLASDGRQVAEGQFRMSFSPVDAERQLARRLDNYYRNANARIVLTKTLINRLLPEPKPEYEPVRDTVLGYPVWGRSLNQPKLSVDFVPDAERLLMRFQVKGSISSSTSSTAGPATFFDSSEAYYEANKPLEIEAGGIHLQPAQVTAYSNSRLRGLRTNFDAIPILGSIAQNIARNQHEQHKSEATAEVEWKITSRAQERIDHEAYSRVSAAVDRLRERVFVPLNELELNPVMIESQTSAERMTMRIRLAGDNQLGSHTPRPRAPADSLASIQLHETAINNFLARLELEGRTFTVAELSKHVADKLHRDAWPSNTEHTDVTIRFASPNAISVRCQEGRVILTLAVAELRSPPRAWKDFSVRVMYRPMIQGRSAELARDGVVQLIGRLSTGSQIAVRGIFSKTFSKDGTWRVAPDWLANDSRLADVAISQFAIEDGWLSLAYSPQQATTRRHLFDRQLR